MMIIDDETVGGLRVDCWRTVAQRRLAFGWIVLLGSLRGSMRGRLRGHPRGRLRGRPSGFMSD